MLLIIGLTGLVVVIGGVMENEKIAHIALVSLCIEGILFFICLIFFVWLR